MEINDILSKRQERYGNFKDLAETSQQFKSVMKNTPNWHRLSADKREALEVTCTKMARILCGDSEYKDSWDDIGGYTQLVSQSLEDGQ